MALVRRAIQSKLLGSSDVPVLILEGARAVGKTTLVRDQIADESDFTYVSLIDPTTRDSAIRDIDGWLRGLRRPVIIDEAQLLTELPLALKRLTDGARLDSGQVLLTGSASIGRAGLDGADPLARRSQRLTMSPLTMWELKSQTGSLIDLLFDADLQDVPNFTSATSDLVHDLSFGGFPSYVVPAGALTRSRLHERIRSDTLALVSDRILPDVDLDSGIARTILDHLLRMPGAIYNASRFGQLLDLDRRTVDRYVAMLERLFLIHRLPNLATSANRQNLARGKVHAVDTSFSVESLGRAGVDIREDRKSFGDVLESHVANQVLASATWASLAVDFYYWRLASRTNPEVDIVMVDGRGRTVGIEVKAADVVSDSDFRGLRSLADARGLHRGIVAYTGSRVVSFGDDLWAVPVGALGSSEFFAKASEDRPALSKELIAIPSSVSTGKPLDFDATIFLSYVHDDNERSGGRIVAFARDLVSTYSYLFGHDLQLFVDRDDIRWGENWSDRLSQELRSTAFLVSVVTPRYLKSDACRAEVLEFAAAARQASEPRLLLPLMWVDIEGTDVVAADDPVRQQILASQFVDVTAIRQTAAGSLEYEALLERVARRLRSTILGEGDVATINLSDGGPDLFELQSKIEDRIVGFEPAVASFKQAFEEIGTVFADAPPLAGGATYARAAALERLGRSLADPVEHLSSATSELGRVWRDLDADVSRAVVMIADMPNPKQKMSLFESLDAIARSLEIPGSELMAQQMVAVGNISRHLRPMSRAVSSALQLLNGIRDSAIAWRNRL